MSIGILAFVFASPAHAYRILFAPWPETPGGYFGGSMAEVGDIDANGLSDFVIGDTSYDDGGFNTGRAYLYLLTPGGTAPDPVVLTYGQTPGLFGKDIAAGGDINNDGYDDFLITSENIRAVHLFLGAADPDSITRVVVPSPNAERSTSVAGVGDVNNDGYDDFLVGALWDDVAWLYYGGETVDLTPDLTLSESGAFGITVAPLGDFNRDGYADFAVGAPRFAANGIVPGAVFFYLGGAVPDAVADFTLLGEQHQENFGRPLKLGGDLDGNGIRDLLVAAPSFDGVAEWSGRLDIFYLGSSVGAVRGTSIYGEISHEIWLVDGNADIDLDGIPDVVMAPDLSTTGPIAMFSGATLSRQIAVSTSWANWIQDTRTTALASIADVNGDGYRELLVGNGLDRTMGFGGRVTLLAGGHRVFPRFRLASASSEANSSVELILYASLETTDPLASVPLAALDLVLTYDATLVTFVGAEPVDPTAPWVHAANASALSGQITIAMASTTPAQIDAVEQPFLRLQFQTGTALGRSAIALSSIETHSSADIPAWPLFESGTLSVIEPTSVPTPQVPASVRAYPNPFNPKTTIEWSSPVAGPAALTIFDSRGHKVWHQDVPHAEVGLNSTRWTGVDDRGRAVSSGTYLLEVRGGSWRARTRLTLVR